MGVRGTTTRRNWSYQPELYAPPRYRRACTYEAFIPARISGFSEPIAPDTAASVSDAESAVYSLNARARPALLPLARLLLRTESVASSKVEGLALDARELARAELKAEVGAKTSPTASEILSNIDAMEVAINTASQAGRVTKADILRVHRTLMSADSSQRVTGHVRDEQNWIGGNDYNPCGAAYVPPPPEFVDDLLDDLCAAMSADDLPPLVQAALVHGQFELIHPFWDGNGRTGRALIHVVLKRRGLASDYVPPISVVLAANKSRYIAGLTAFREGDTNRWVTQFATATTRAARLAEQYLQSVEALQSAWRTRLKDASNPRADSVAWQIIDELPGNPMITVPVAVAVTGKTKAVVNSALAALEECGVLVRLAGGNRNRAWEAKGLLDLLMDLEAARPRRRR
jgi:Fic family protein